MRVVEVAFLEAQYSLEGRGVFGGEPYLRRAAVGRLMSECGEDTFARFHGTLCAPGGSDGAKDYHPKAIV